MVMRRFESVAVVASPGVGKNRLWQWFDEWVQGGRQHPGGCISAWSCSAFGRMDLARTGRKLEAGTRGRGTLLFRHARNKERRFIPLRLDDAPIKGSMAQFL